MGRIDFDLDGGTTARTVMWGPDRELNPQYADKPDIDPMGLIITHPDGCTGIVYFDLPGVRELVGADHDLWDLHSLDPLHIEPSVMRSGEKNCPLEDHTECQHHDHHGWIRDGKWVDC